MNLDKTTGLPYLPEDLEMRLGRSLIRYKDKPFFVTEPGRNGRNCFLRGIFTLTGEEDVIQLPNKDLDIRPVPLGYMNLVAQTLYVMRKPQRRYKQGFSSQAFTTSGPGRINFMIRECIYSKSLAKTVVGDYPDMEQALDHTKKKKGSCAFHRRFAFYFDRDLGIVQLHYRGVPVGMYMSGEVMLSEPHQFLAEELERAMQ